MMMMTFDQLSSLGSGGSTVFESVEGGGGTISESVAIVVKCWSKQFVFAQC